MKRNTRYLCALLFIPLCVAVLIYLYQFSVSPESMIYLPWESSFRTAAGGVEEAYEYDIYAAPEQSAYTYRFTATVPDGLYGGYLLFETSGLDITLTLDGVEIYSSSVLSSDEIVNLAQAHVPLPTGCGGKTLSAVCRSIGGNGLFPPLMRYTDDVAREAETIAYANLFGIPAGVYAFSFILICALFFLGVAWGQPDWSLISLAVAALGLTVHPIAVSCGYYFLPAWLNGIVTLDKAYIVIILALVLYMFLNRRRDFWRLFGRFSLISGALLAAFYLVSLVRGGYLAGFINQELRSLAEFGIFSGLAYWLTFWLVAVCAVISAYSLTRAVVKIQADAKAFAVRERLSAENYRLIEQKLRATAEVRHEANHRLAALDALYRKGDMTGLGEMLEELTRNSAIDQPITYTENIAINTILQNASARSADAGIRFEATARASSDMRISEEDLCGLLMNMLDNAIDAARRIENPQNRFICFQAQMSGNFLAIRCENSYNGEIRLNDNGLPHTSKPAPELHGFGLVKMRQIAEKYGSILDFSYTGDRFTVQTALCLPDGGQSEKK